MTHIRLASAVAVALALPTVTLAGGIIPITPTTTFAERSETTLFAGISVVIGSRGDNVEGILGVAHGEIDLDGDVTGAKASAHFGLQDGFSFDKIKLTGLVGDDGFQAEIGGGYSFKSGQPFAVLGTNAEYFATGVDVFFDWSYDGYLTLHTIGQLSLDQVTTGGGSPVMFVPDTE